jgi:hypothetical protein
MVEAAGLTRLEMLIEISAIAAIATQFKDFLAASRVQVLPKVEGVLRCVKN